MDTISSCVCTAYLGLQFREVYDKSKLVSNLIVPLFILSSLVHPSFIRILELAYTTMEIESILESQVSGLLESQRAAFNVYTGIQSALLSQSAVSKENRDMLDRWGGLTVRKVLTPSELPLESPAYLTVYLVLDEYLDKMASSVRLSLLSKLNKLIYAIKSANGVPDLLSVDESVRVNNNPTSYSTEFTVLVVTHSARVLRDCNSRSAVMNNGRLYDLQDSYQKLNMPAQLQLLD